MIIRHGEKPADPPAQPPPYGIDAAGEQSEHSLLPRGWQRAGALAVILGEGAQPPLATPQAVYAPDYGHDVVVHRAVETVTPLAHRLGLTVQTPARKGEEDHFVDQHLMATTGTALVCWEHHHIPALAEAYARAVGLAVAELPPVARFWPEDDFWSVILFRSDGGGPRVEVVSQAALDGDPPR